MKLSNLLILLITPLILLAWTHPERHFDENHHHNARNCYGYAMGRAAGFTTGDPYCNPKNTFSQGIFGYTFYTNMSQIRAGDIIAWGTAIANNPNGCNHPAGHVAYVVEVPSSGITNDITIDQVDCYNGSEQTGITVGDVTNQGSVVGFFRNPNGSAIRMTLANDFGGGDLKIRDHVSWRSTSRIGDGQYSTVDHGHPEYCNSAKSFDIQAIDNQAYGETQYQFNEWMKGDVTGYSSNATLSNESISSSTLYEAQFNIYYPPIPVDVTGPTTLTGTQGTSRAPQYHATGTWTASITGETGSFDYQWYYETSTGWQELSGETGYQLTKTLYYDPNGRDLKCEVTQDGREGKDSIHVYITGAEPDRESSIPQDVVLGENSPNPFNPNTQIKFGLPTNQRVEIDIYSISGKKVKTLVNNVMNAGYHTIDWNATNANGAKVSSGVYIYQLRCGNEVFTKKMIFAK